MKRLLPTLAALFVLSIAAAFSLPASAIEYRTVDAVTVLYDAPSQRGSKLYVIRRYTPVEVVVALDGWVVGVEGLVVVGTMGAAAASVPSVAALGGAPPDA